mgnify:CR=1 FL=1
MKEGFLKADISKMKFDGKRTEWKMDMLERKVEIVEDDEMFNDKRKDDLKLKENKSN